MTAIILTVLITVLHDPAAARQRGIRRIVAGTVAEMAAKWASFAEAGNRCSKLLEEPYPYRA